MAGQAEVGAVVGQEGGRQVEVVLVVEARAVQVEVVLVVEARAVAVQGGGGRRWRNG